MAVADSLQHGQAIALVIGKRHHRGLDVDLAHERIVDHGIDGVENLRVVVERIVNHDRTALLILR